MATGTGFGGGFKKKMTKILQAKPTHRTTYTKDFYSCQKTFGVFIFESTNDA